MAERVHILLVEDDRPVAVLLQRALEGQGRRVTAITDGLDAYTALHGQPFDIILLDHHITGLVVH